MCLAFLYDLHRFSSAFCAHNDFLSNQFILQLPRMLFNQGIVSHYQVTLFQVSISIEANDHQLFQISQVYDITLFING